MVPVTVTVAAPTPLAQGVPATGKVVAPPTVDAEATATVVASNLNATAAVNATATQSVLNQQGVPATVTGMPPTAVAAAPTDDDADQDDTQATPVPDAATDDAGAAQPTEVAAVPDEAEGESLLPPVIDSCSAELFSTASIVGESTLPDDQTEALDDLLVTFVTLQSRELYDDEPAPRVSLLVESPDGVYDRSLGVVNAETCAPMQPGSRWEIGSNTKMMTAAMIFQLAEEGVLSIDDPLSDWLPEYAEALPNGEAITIRQLLNHTSGLYDYFNGVNEDGLGFIGFDDVEQRERIYTPTSNVRRLACLGCITFTHLYGLV